MKNFHIISWNIAGKLSFRERDNGTNSQKNNGMNTVNLVYETIYV